MSQTSGILILLLFANPFYSNAVGGVQIKVKQEDEEKALAIIAETDKTGNEFSVEMPTDDEIVGMPREAVMDSRIVRWFGRIFGK